MKDWLMKLAGIVSTAIGIALLLVFLWSILRNGLARIDWDFITSLPSRRPERAGIWTAIAGSIWILVLTFLIAFPLGVATGIYMEEYGKKGRLNALLEVNIANLAGVPSIVYGLLGLAVFVRVLNMGNSVLAGACTLSLLVVPIIIVATREAVRSIPPGIREASYALGAGKWQTIWNQVLPASLGGVLTGVILAISRAVGETAPLIVIGALAYVAFAPTSPMDQFTLMPIQIFNWVGRPQHGFVTNAAAGIIVLLAFTILMNGIAVFFRNKWQKRMSK